MALSADAPSTNYANGGIKGSRRPASGTYAAGKVAFLGGINMAVDGVGQPVVSGASMRALCYLLPGADANGGVYLSARRRAVRIRTLGGQSKTLGVDSISFGATLDITIQLGTDNSSVVTTTGNALVGLILGHGMLSELLRCQPQGTGASISTVAAMTAVPCIALLGVPSERFGDAASNAAQTLPAELCFHVGDFGIPGATGSLPVVGSVGYLVDDNTLSATADSLSIQVPVRSNERGFYFADLQEAF